MKLHYYEVYYEKYSLYHGSIMRNLINIMKFITKNLFMPFSNNEVFCEKQQNLLWTYLI